MLAEVSHPFRFLRSRTTYSGWNDRLREQFRDMAAGGFRAAPARARELQSICQRLCKLHGISLEVTGSVPGGTAIYVSNHLGYVDPLAICSLAACAPIAKAEVATWPIVGQVSRRLNVIFVQRSRTWSATRALLRAKRLLEADVCVLNFPEGTTTRGEMRAFQRGVFGLSALMNVPIVPFALSFDDPELCWVDDQTLLGHYSIALAGKPQTIHVEVGPRLFMDPRESAADFAARVRLWIAAARARRAAAAEGAAQRAAAQATRGARGVDGPSRSLP